MFAVLLGCSGPDVAPDAPPVDAPGADTRPDASGSPDGGVRPATCADIAVPTDVATRGSWDTAFTLPGVTGLDGYTPIVRDVATAPDGSAIVAGYFSWAGSTRALGVVRLTGRTLTPLDVTLPEAPEGYAAAAIAEDGTIVLAQYRRDDTRVGAMIRIAGDTVETIATFTGNVRSLAFVDDALWAMGTLALSDGGPQGLAIYQGGSWHGAPGGGPDGPVYELLERSTGELVVGGEFFHIGGIEAAKVASFDGSVWTALNMPEALRVMALAEDDGALVAGGVFTLAEENRPAASIGRWNGSAWEILEGGVAAGEAFGAVSDLIVEGDDLIVVGCFDHVGGNGASDTAVAAESMARLTDGTWHPLADATRPVGSQWFAPFVCGYEPAPAVVWEMSWQRVTRTDEMLVFGGAYGGVDGVVSQSVIGRDETGFVALGQSGLGVSGAVSDLEVGGPSCTVHALVSGTHVGGMALSGPVYALDEAGWHAAGAPLPEGARCSAMAVDAGGRIFLACEEEALPPDFVLQSMVLGSTETGWEQIGEVMETMIQDIAIAPDGDAYVLFGTERGRVARVGESALEPLPGEFDAVLLEMAFGRGEGLDLVVGGPFTQLDGAPMQRIARWNGTAWSGLGSGLPTTPSALAVGTDVVYAATHDEGTSGRVLIGRFDGTAWTDIATPANGLMRPFELTVHTFTSLIVRGDVLLASGYVWPEAGGRNVFAFDGETFRSLGGGAGAITVDAMAVGPEGIVIGGSIAEVGSGATLRPSVGVARFTY